jgi:hypothetical protein
MGSNGQGYFIKTDGANSWMVYRPAGGSEQILQTLNTGFATSDVAEIKVAGTTLSAYKNGFQVGVNQTHSALTGGRAGLGVSPDNNTSADNWQAGGLLPGGGGEQDLAPAALPPIALVTQPSGRGNKNIEVIRDGVMPPAGSTDPSLQYDTYEGGGDKPLDWIGYAFSSPQSFFSVVFQEGVHSTDGGWFDSLWVQRRVNNQWVDIQDLQCTPPYAAAKGTNYGVYELFFSPVTGDGIRIIGHPGGSAHYFSVGELRVYMNSNVSTEVTPTIAIPKEFALQQNFPNPFNPTTSIAYALPRSSFVRITIFNVLGQEVRRLVSGYFDGGTRVAVWDGRDDGGENVPSGVYFYRMEVGQFGKTRTMVLLK